MQISFDKKHTYCLMEENVICTNNSRIFRAQDLEFNRTVCVKQVHFEGNSLTEIRKKCKRTMLEVQAMVSISENSTHLPGIYQTYFDEQERNYYIIMQWIAGESLENKMNAAPLDFVRWMMKLCDILSVMEKRNIYHKDIKPANILIDKFGELYLIDFDISVAAPNQVEGTLHYKAPEMDINSRYMGRDKVDIFAIGVILYEYYTKEVPIRGIDYYKNRRRGTDVLKWDKFTEPLEKNPDMPQAVNDVIVKCMKLDVKQRYENSKELKRALAAAERSIRNAGKRKNGKTI